jgi:hypothetical protein
MSRNSGTDDEVEPKDGGQMEWPPRSPELVPLDFYQWSLLETKVYAVKVLSIEHLKKHHCIQSDNKGEVNCPWCLIKHQTMTNPSCPSRT